MTSAPTLIARRESEHEVYPYRRIWRTATFEAIILLALTGAVLLADRFLTSKNITLSPTQRHVFGLGFAFTPLALWLLITYRGEQAAAKPRARLFTIVLLSGLTANAIGVPVVERLFAINEWLTNAAGSTRILGYIFTVGITQEFLKYAVVRYSVWPIEFRIRSDGIAYAIAAGIGYATVLNLNYVFNNDAAPVAVALRVAEFTLSQVAVSTVMGFFLAELKLSQTSIYALPLGLLLASLLNGISQALRGALILAGIAPDASGNNAVQGLGASVALLIVLFAGFNFLINNADERASLRNRPDFNR